MSTFKRRLTHFASIPLGILLLLSTSANAELPGTYQGWVWETSLGHLFGFGLQEESCFSQLDVTVNGDLTWTASGTDEVCWGRTSENSIPPRAYFNYDGTNFVSAEDFSSRSTRSLVSAGGNLYELYGEDVIGMTGQGEERLGTILSEPAGDNLLIIGGTDSFADVTSNEAFRFVDVLVKSTSVARVAENLVG
jgi:hypothetical protein